jgi:hypothetical protein
MEEVRAAARTVTLSMQMQETSTRLCVPNDFIATTQLISPGCHNFPHNSTEQATVKTNDRADRCANTCEYMRQQTDGHCWTPADYRTRDPVRCLISTLHIVILSLETTPKTHACYAAQIHAG